MSILKADYTSTHTYKFTADTIANLIRKDLGLDDKAEVKFVLQTRSSPDDRYSTQYFHGVEVTVKGTK